VNPWNRTRTSGGSSGGESGLVSARCSPSGFGTDVGGSVRIPSLYCGIYGFKLTNGRVTKMGCTVPNPENKGWNLSIIMTDWEVSGRFTVVYEEHCD